MGNDIDVWGSVEERRNAEYRMAKLEPNLFNTLSQQIICR